MISRDDLEQIGKALETAEPLQPVLSAYRAYVLVGLIQLALRHPMMIDGSRPSAQIGYEMAASLIEQLRLIDPLIADSLEMGWYPALDQTNAEFSALFNPPPDESYLDA